MQHFKQTNKKNSTGSGVARELRSMTSQELGAGLLEEMGDSGSRV